MAQREQILEAMPCWGEPLLYIASPLSHPEPAVMAWRREQARDFTGRLIQAGFRAFCPVVYTAEMQECCPELRSLEFDPEGLFWYRFDLDFLRRANGLVLLRLPGWEGSAGMELERRWAEAWGMPVYEVDSDLDPDTLRAWVRG